MTFQCPSGFLLSPSNQTCYAISNANVTFIDAQSQCSLVHPQARVAMFQSRQDSIFAQTAICSKSDAQICWIALRRNLPCVYNNATVCGGDSRCACAFSWVDQRTRVEKPLTGDKTWWAPFRPLAPLSMCTFSSERGWKDANCRWAYKIATLCEGELKL
jgi:hypothetical protein